MMTGSSIEALFLQPNPLATVRCVVQMGDSLADKTNPLDAYFSHPIQQTVGTAHPIRFSGIHSTFD